MRAVCSIKNTLHQTLNSSFATKQEAIRQIANAPGAEAPQKSAPERQVMIEPKLNLDPKRYSPTDCSTLS